MRGLIAFLEEHGSAVEADFCRYYPNQDLKGLFTGELSWRRFKILLENLPDDSRTARSVHGDAAYWDTKTELLAVLVDATQAANWQRGEGRGSRPTPIPRPKDKNAQQVRAQAQVERQKEEVLSQDDFDKKFFR